MEKASPLRATTIARTTRIAEGSPSIANATPASVGCEPDTNVIRGCADATAAPRACNTSSSSLPRTPLECNATFPFQVVTALKFRAALQISPSGTQHQIKSAY